MDNLCHTLIGAALGEAGLKRRTPLALATLMIGANLPDVDVASYWHGEVAALGCRRGWTHGVLILPLLPFVLTGLMLAWDRFVRRRSRPGLPPARPGALLLLSAVSILSHPFLDWLNTYGMRWLMPFSGTWFYGDTLFIADLWIWIALGSGIALSRWRARRQPAPAGERPLRPARIALAAVAVYIALLYVSQAAAAGLARAELRRAGIAAGRVMASPVMLDPLRRRVVAEAGDGYVEGTVDWRWRPAFSALPGTIAKGDAHPAVTAAARTREGTIFLDWARFPFFLIEQRPDGTLVRMVDLRYAREPGTGFGTLDVLVPAGSPPSPTPP